MLLEFAAATHQVSTAVVVAPPDAEAIRLAETAVVQFPRLPIVEVEAYLDTAAWVDKAGAYNLFDRQAAGWDIRVEGDPTTVVGLPMVRLKPILARIGIEPVPGTP